MQTGRRECGDRRSAASCLIQSARALRAARAWPTVNPARWEARIGSGYVYGSCLIRNLHFWAQRPAEFLLCKRWNSHR